jgi:hypothetical protein
MKNLHMTELILILIMGFVSSTVIGCAPIEQIPKGSTKTGALEGSFAGTRFVGSCRIDIFELQDGTKRFEGSFSGEGMDATVFLRGTVSGNQLEGGFQDPADGSISGSLSPDGSQIKGTYKMTSPSMDNGTWQATEK